MDQVNLPEVEEAGSATGEIAGPNECAGVGVAFDAVAFQQHDRALRWFAEAVTAIGAMATTVPSSESA